ncbi:putative RNA-binding protein [Thermobifida fusca TM51]|uniref:RNA-binding protein n=1 Tax=Thermobifida fusca TM51 TaxID=1169414 RepID=A0A9P2WR72_THEFU|nr:putative RNA-binding protein [Thermobifida fusca TM51]
MCPENRSELLGSGLAALHPRVQFRFGRAAVHGFRSPLVLGAQGFDEGSGDPLGGGERRSRVEQDRVPHRAGAAVQELADDAGVELDVSAAQRFRGGPRNAQVCRVQLLVADRAVGDDPHRRGRRGGELVQPVVAAEHEGVHTALGEDPGHDLAHVPVEDADRGGGGPGRVGQRSQEVEDGGHGELAPRLGRVLQRGVVERREAEGDVDLFGHRDRVRGVQVDDHAQPFQHVGGAARGGGCPVAVLDHPRPGSRGDDRGHGGDVDRVCAVAAGSYDVEGGAGDGDRHRVVEHALGQTPHLSDAFALGAQRDREPRDLGVGGRTGHDLVHCPLGVVGRQRGAVQQCADQVGPGSFTHVRIPCFLAFTGGGRTLRSTGRRVWWPGAAGDAIGRCPPHDAVCQRRAGGTGRRGVPRRRWRVTRSLLPASSGPTG